MVHTKGNVHFILEVAQQLAKANVHFTVVFNSEGATLETQHQSTLYRAIEAVENFQNNCVRPPREGV